jgi:hypothetical protein
MRKIAKVTRLQRIFSDRSTGVFNGKIFVERASKKQMRFKKQYFIE